MPMDAQSSKASEVFEITHNSSFRSLGARYDESQFICVQEVNTFGLESLKRHVIGLS